MSNVQQAAQEFVRLALASGPVEWNAEEKMVTVIDISVPRAAERLGVDEEDIIKAAHFLGLPAARNAESDGELRIVQQNLDNWATSLVGAAFVEEARKAHQAKAPVKDEESGEVTA